MQQFHRGVRRVHGDLARHVEQAFRVIEDDPHARVDQVGGDLLRSTRRHRQHAPDDVLVAHDVLSRILWRVERAYQKKRRKTGQLFSDKVGHSDRVILRDSRKCADLHFLL